MVVNKLNISHRSPEYDYVAQLVRWLALATVLLTFPLNSPRGIVVILLASAFALYNLLGYVPRLKNVSGFSSQLSLMGFDLFFATALLVISGGIYSPYFFYLSLMLITAAHRSLRSFTAVFLFAIGASLLLGAAALVNPIVLTRLQTVFLNISLLTSIGILVSTLAYLEREEWLSLLGISLKADRERQSLLTLINSLADAVIALDGRGRVITYNGAALALLNTNQSLNAKKLSEILPVRDKNGKKIDILRLADKNHQVIRRNDLVLKVTDEDSLILDISIAPIHSLSSQKNRSGYILILRDITKEKSLEQQREEFISVASHELRTPLAIAEANLSTALLPNYAKIEPKARKLLEQAHDNTVFLGELIKDLTTLSRAEEGRLVTEERVVSPSILLEGLQRDYRMEAQKKGLALEIAVKDDLKPIVIAESIVHEILQNFVTNAIKYTEKGSVTLSAEPTDDGVIFSVKDTGIGIATGDKQHIFGKFYRSEDYRTRQTGGTGLGLYITKQLAARVKGEISFKSKLNFGSTFYLKVPSGSTQV